ncbi:hypothetical protein CLNEO_04220 [Anaerotignum neopropionicum]|uniref:Uncharacterized protein n=1 Tax=Anaerotignum neopropionicum TaxID=36847 RepID=A0A136WIL1_9FIRM|nr:hypothetical protein CLNEO_02930 [Anaerotignum neopropionicum]KXL54317.1 hypothetical protein CLNEO_04220 [Anaerotignum neopropionicum]
MISVDNVEVIHLEIIQHKVHNTRSLNFNEILM